MACPNEECKELFLTASLRTFTRQSGEAVLGKTLESWTLRPQAAVKILPDYVPAPILQDHREACLILDLSPKACATLSRRCLQGMIRDFWGIVKARLAVEIDALENRVDAQTWEAIDGVRHIGNIGATWRRTLTWSWMWTQMKPRY